MKRSITPQVAALALALAVLATFNCHSFAAERPTPPEQHTVQQAWERLLSTRRFAFGGVGFAGTVSEGEKAFQIVVASTNALDLFQAVLKNGTPEAQMYALCGVRKLARESFKVHAQAFVDANSVINTMSGCLVSEERISDVVARIAAGSYDRHMGITQIRQGTPGRATVY